MHEWQTSGASNLYAENSHEHHGVNADIKQFDRPCIFCQVADNARSVEHIIPRSLGNLHYVLPSGVVCQECNSRFSHFENRVVSSKLFMSERRRLRLLKPSHSDLSVGDLDRQDVLKLLLKMAYEGLYHSRPKVWMQCDWTFLLSVLLKGESDNLFDRRPSTNMEFRSIPGWIDRFRLSNNALSIAYAEEGDILWVKFVFGRIEVTSPVAMVLKI